MKTTVFLCLLFIACSGQQSVSTSKKESAVLVFFKTAAFVHSSIPKGIETLQQLGKENNFKVDTTRESSFFSADQLKKYDAVIFYNTTGDVLNGEQEKAFENYINNGGGFVGVHAATDTEYDWPWYGKLVGAYFLNHPKPQSARFEIKDKNFPATRFFSETTWTIKDEFYNFKDISPDITTLFTIDESSYEGGQNGNSHPMSWYHKVGKGRSFYTALGHVEEIYDDPDFRKHLVGGIQYAIGKNK